MYKLSPSSVLSDRTDPTTPDTDGDGYWDGWIGVHGVNHSENVILYREHLQDGNGIEGDERVDEQVKIPEVDSNDPGARLNSGGPKYHSAVHLGELHWERFDPSQRGDPTDGSVIPDPNLAVEVDRYVNADSQALTALDSAEANYALYGMDVDFHVDQSNLTDTQLNREKIVCNLVGCTEITLDRRPPTSYDDAKEFERLKHDDPSKAYLFITTKGSDNAGSRVMSSWVNVDGVASTDGSDWVGGHVEGFGFGTLLFTNDHNGDPTPIAYQKTIVHEIGHLIGAGRNDDSSRYGTGVVPDEVYSGNDGDQTKEFVELRGNPERFWSVMSRGWHKQVGYQPMNHDYVAYSIEELLSIEFSKIDTVSD